MPLDAETQRLFNDSLARCNSHPKFLDRFYEIFLASSPKVREKFANTDFARQKEALRASFDAMLLAAKEHPDAHLQNLAERHSRRQLDIGAELYDLWLDSLLGAVRECDPDSTPEVEKAWETVMMMGIAHLLRRY